MKRLRKMISFLLVLALMLGLVPTSFAEPEEVFAVETPTGPTSGTCGAQGENIQWQLMPDSEAEWDLVQGQPYKLTLTGSGEMANYAYGKSPWNEYRAFITSISIDEGITTIGDMNFYGLDSLKCICLPASIVSIGESAFAACNMLESVECGAGLKIIGERAFSNNRSLTTVIFNEGLEEIGKEAFLECKILVKANLPESLVALRECAF